MKIELDIDALRAIERVLETTEGTPMMIAEYIISSLSKVAKAQLDLEEEWNRATVNTETPQPSEPRLQLVVLYSDNTHHYYPINYTQGWKIDTTHRCIVVGKGLPRTFIPLDTVRSFTIEVIKEGSTS